ncbi:hypothetical protein [Consotaella salsifontis]|uniref:hypothetical protein n=1 Tax=Consotaella salsifontis TaxID=1365950 RepID=UPI00099ABDB5|nr:hypothetical protein [Consotaella salsifontis]
MSDEVVLEALAARLEMDGRDPADAPALMSSARGGDAKAVALLRGVVLPAPRASLPMPVQQLVREKRERFLPFGRLALRRR